MNAPGQDFAPARVSLLKDSTYFDALIESIRSAQKSIWAHVFSFNLRPADDGELIVRSVARALGDAVSRGVQVRILLGGTAGKPLTLPAGNILAQRLLAGLGVECRTFRGADRDSSHAKYLLIDGHTLVCGSHNWSPRALSRGVDTAVAVRSRTVAAAAGLLFKAAWKRAEGTPADEEIMPGVPLSSVLCDPGIYDRFRALPEHDAPAEEEGMVRLLPDAAYYPALLDAIRGARHTLRVSMFFFSNPPGKKHPNYALIGELLRAHTRGVDIRILLDADRTTDVYHSRRINRQVKDYLSSKGIDVRFDAADSVNHAKFLVADGERILLGSHNWTSGSFVRQHELSVEVHSPGIAAEGTKLVDRHFRPRRARR